MDRREFVDAVAWAACGTLLAPRLAQAEESEQEIPRRYLYSYTHRVDMERGFKFHCLVPRHTRGMYGRHEYAGFFTVRVGENPWMFVGDVAPQHTRIPQTLADLTKGRFSILRNGPNWVVEQFIEWNALYPATWLSAAVGSETQAQVIGALLGWKWAQQHSGTVWFADGQELRRPLGEPLELPSECRWFGYHNAGEPFTGIIAFPSPCKRAWVDDDGLYWAWGVSGGRERQLLCHATYILAPEVLSADEMDRLVRLLGTPPAQSVCTAAADTTPLCVITVDGAQAICVPPSLSWLRPSWSGAALLTSAAGTIPIVQGSSLSLDLPSLPQVEVSLPRVAAPPTVREELAQHVTDVLSHRKSDGRFDFAQGRTFYDSITCACLAQALPVLPDELARETRQALRDCLDTLCDNHQRSPAYGLLVPPEVPSFVETSIDYPEIAAMLLYAILAYTLNAEPEYATRRADLIETHLRQIRQMTTPEGLAWARADTQHMHLIAESALGGYIAWCSLYHLGRLLNRPWAIECSSRAALNWAAYRGLFRWRTDDYGDVGVVEGWSNWCAELDQSVPWSYVQTTWFSYVPFVTYEPQDEFRVWKNLREQPWWEYTSSEARSRQRCYDYANMLAFARAGLWEVEVKPYYQAVANRPFWFDTFDATPVMAIAALVQLAAMGLL